MEENATALARTTVPDIAKAMPAGLLDVASIVRLKAGEPLFRTGGKVRNAYLAISGEVRLNRTGRSGVEITLQRSRMGFVAEASLDSKAYHCDAIASVDSTLLAFPAELFKAALTNDPAFSRHWQRLLAREVRKLRAQCERLGLKTAEERIVHYLESEGVDGAVELSMTKKEWATDLGLTHEALYRALKRLKVAGSLRTEGALIFVSASRAPAITDIDQVTP
ncbi:MAG: Crp/Fnr family transcriptional regulator [Curvibacter sp.]|nr:MAG: Crp/Fnr family transcriptional regulator [Curvibacter sp.]